MKRIIKQALCFSIYYSGSLRIFDFLAKQLRVGSLTVFVAHRIIDENEKSTIDSLYLNWGQGLSKTEFERRIKYLKSRYRVVSLEQAVGYLTKKKLSGRYVVLTFDDGYEDLYKVVFPILKGYGLPATFFLTTGVIETNEVLWFDEILCRISGTDKHVLTLERLNGRKFSLSNSVQKSKAISELCFKIANLDESSKNNVMNEIFHKLGTNRYKRDSFYLSWEQAREMTKCSLITFGAHSITHPVLTKISRDKAFEEIQKSRQDIEKNVGCSVEFFSYPNGQFDEEIIALIKKTGFIGVCSTGNGSQNNLYAMKRLELGTQPFYVFVAEASGIFALVKRFWGRSE